MRAVLKLEMCCTESFASKVFQKLHLKVRISGIHIIAENIIIAAQEHDNMLQQVLEIGKVHVTNSTLMTNYSLEFQKSNI